MLSLNYLNLNQQEAKAVVELQQRPQGVSAAQVSPAVVLLYEASLFGAVTPPTSYATKRSQARPMPQRRSPSSSPRMGKTTLKSTPDNRATSEATWDIAGTYIAAMMSVST